MTIDYDIKKHQKIVKKYGTIRVNDGFTLGEITITRCKLTLSTLNPHNIKRCEVDVIYKGTLQHWGRCMGPSRQLLVPEEGWKCFRWGSKVRRNRAFRSNMRNSLIRHLRFFGVDLSYSFDFDIKKIVWDE